MSSLETARVANSQTLSGRVAIVFLGTLAVSLITLLVLRLYAHRYAQDDVAAYLIFRLYSTLIIAAGSFGMPIAIQRTVAFLGATPRRAGTAALTGIVIGMSGVAVLCAVLALLREPVARLLEHPAAASLWLATLAYTLAQFPATLLSFVEIARFRVLQSVFVLFCGFGLGPLLAVVLFPHRSFFAVVMLGALASLLLILPSSISTLRWAVSNGFSRPTQEGRVLLRYGLPRVVAGTSEFLLDPALPWLAVQSSLGLVNAGYLAIGLSLLRPLSPVAGALNQVMVPTAATFAARDDSHSQSRHMTRITEWAIHVGLFCTLQMVVWCDVLIRLWLGPRYLPATPVTRILLLALAPWFVYLSSRGIIDGHTEKAINARNLMIALFAMLAAGWAVHLLGYGVLALAGCYLGARLLLAGLTLAFGVHSLRLRLGGLLIPTSLLASALLALAAYALRMSAGPQHALLLMLLFTPLAGLVYVVFLMSRGAEWGAAIAARIPAARALVRERSVE